MLASLDAYAPAIERRRVDLALFGDRIFVNNASLGAYATAVQSDSSWTTPGFDVNSTEPLIDIGVDGEALRLPPPLRFRSRFVRAHPHAGARSRRQTCRRSRQGEHRVGSRARRTPRPLTVPSAGTGR